MMSNINDFVVENDLSDDFFDEIDAQLEEYFRNISMFGINIGGLKDQVKAKAQQAE